MKVLLKTLALLYGISSLVMLMMPWAAITRAINQKSTVENVLMLVLALVLLIIPLIGIFCSIQHLRKNDIDTAYAISVFTGLTVCFISAGVVTRYYNTTYPDWPETIGLTFSIFSGIYIHKVFYKYIKRSFRVCLPNKPVHR